MIKSKLGFIVSASVLSLLMAVGVVGLNAKRVEEGQVLGEKACKPQVVVVTATPTLTPEVTPSPTLRARPTVQEATESAD